MFDIDKFIECIHERPAIWEKTSKDYFDKLCRERSWREVGKTMYKNWMYFESTERVEKVKEMKNKWQHIRDNFHKFVNQGKSSEAPSKKKRKYVNADSLQFLVNTLEKSKASGSTIANEEEEEEESEENGEQDEDENEFVPSAASKKPTTNCQIHAGSRQRCKSNHTEFQKKLLHNYVEKSEEEEEEDSEKMFLMSILPDYRKLDYDEKLEFRIKTLQFFQNIRQKKNSGTPSSPDTSPQTSHPLTKIIPSKKILNPPSFLISASSPARKSPPVQHSTTVNYDDSSSLQDCIQ